MLTAITSVERQRLAPSSGAYVMVKKEGAGKETVLSWKPKKGCFQEVTGHLH